MGSERDKDAAALRGRLGAPDGATEGVVAPVDGAAPSAHAASPDGATVPSGGTILPDGASSSDAAAPTPQARLVACDLDGVLYRGTMVLPGAVAAVKDAVARGLIVRYVSNNSTAHRRVVAERLAGMGYPADEEMVITSAYITGRWLRARLAPGAPIMVVGEEGLIEELTEAGFSAYRAGEAPPPDVAPPSQQAPLSQAEAPTPAAVVVGMDRSFTYAKLAAAQKAIMEGALFVATNRDATFPTPDGLMPGAGAVVAAVEVAAQKTPVLIGKPSPISAEVLADATGVAAGETVFIGDRVSTDIVMGCEAGMKTVLVLTGVTCAEGSQNALADFVLADLSGLGEVLECLGCDAPGGSAAGA